MPRSKLTIMQKILLSLSRQKRGASWRRLAGWWHNEFSSNNIYQTLHRLKRAGLVSKLDRERFVVTDAGIKRLEKDGLNTSMTGDKEANV